MKKDFVIRGQTASGETEILEFGGYKEGYAYRLIEFKLYGSTNIGNQSTELLGTITAGKTAVAPTDPNFNDEGLIATTLILNHNATAYPVSEATVINDTFLITQNLILAVIDVQSGAPMAVNWQCRFKPVKMSETEMANANLRQFHIYD